MRTVDDADWDPGDPPPERPVHLVLGATGGIGRALCLRLAQEGAHLVAAGRDGGRLEDLAKDTGAEAVAVDARRFDDVAGAVRFALDRFGRLDGVANLVGSMLLKPAHLTRDDEWQDVLATHLGSAFHAVRAAVPAFRPRGGSIVLVSSATARTGLAGHEAIAAAKAGIEGLARSAAASYAASRIRVNCVAPGLVRTPLTEHLLATPAAEAASLALHPLGRLAEPSDVAAAIAWLLGPESAFVTGQVLGVDGGLATLRARARA